MTKRFGLGLEEGGTPFAPSLLYARALFLELLPRLRPDVVPALFNSAHRLFIKFLKESEGEIHSILKDDYPLADADVISSVVGEVNTYTGIDIKVRLFLYSWTALRSRVGASTLCAALMSWADKLNLNDEWLLSHAVVVLRAQYLYSLDADEAWQQAIGELRTDAVCMQGVTHGDFVERGLDKFSFERGGIKITVEGPVFRPVTEFRREAERALKAAGGHKIGGASEAFKRALSLYLNRVAKLRLKEPPRNWAAENQFKWLIEYQVPRVKNYRQIAGEYERDESTIREGVCAAAQLIGLTTLRSSEPGRPNGSKSKIKGADGRGRVRFKEKMRGNR